MNALISKVGVFLGVGLVLLSAAGCGGNDDALVGQIPGATAQSQPNLADSHPAHGPHEGSLIELGNEEYHAELVHDEATGTITVYVLDSSAKKAVPIEAAELHVNLDHDGESQQFTLTASPAADDLPGTASRFVSTSGELDEQLDHEESSAQLVVMIGGKQFRGAIHHDHAHE